METILKYLSRIIIGIFIIHVLTNCESQITPEKTLEINYPEFYIRIKSKDLEHVSDGLTKSQIDSIELKLNTKLPNSYKRFLSKCSGFWAYGGAVQLDSKHPFIHEFKKFDELTDQQKEVVKQKGGDWPPPSSGMICFAEFFHKADGDQVLFDIKNGLVNGEYPVYYYSHETNPPSVIKIADSFEIWLIEFPEYFDNDNK